ncbi:haloacid dehalogenase [Clostridium gelidum]|uniref:Haloacid dehalogenase n=1 Tax=Clostridium gelidum TaxID=704125 RepID=A0ABN6J3V5_9CLOT|nr:HAD-IA family hydrolase [Clostridium gelidum]BCZ49012.1 haloacid dehalogenase [Clostridium gelidum]
MKGKLAILDLDGTLFDTKEVNYMAYKTALEEYGYTIEYDYYCQYCNGRHYTDFLHNIIKSKDEIENIHKRKKELYSKYLDNAILNEHLLNIARGIKEEYYLSLVTTASRKNTEEILDKFFLGTFFDAIFTAEDTKFVKPDPEGFLQAMNHFKISPVNTIIFEDSDVGLEAAQNSGAYYIKVYGYN